MAMEHFLINTLRMNFIEETSAGVLALSADLTKMSALSALLLELKNLNNESELKQLFSGKCI